MSICKVAGPKLSRVSYLDWLIFFLWRSGCCQGECIGRLAEGPGVGAAKGPVGFFDDFWRESVETMTQETAMVDWSWCGVWHVGHVDALTGYTLLRYSS